MIHKRGVKKSQTERPLNIEKMHDTVFKHKSYNWIIPINLIFSLTIMTQDFYNYPFLYIQKMQKLYEALKNSKHGASPSIESFQQSMMQVGLKFWENVWQNPEHMLDAQKRYFDMLNNPQTPASQYQRYFKSNLWNTSPVYQWMKDVYIKTAEWMIETIEEETLGFTRQEREKLMFFTRQWIEGMNPRNFPMTNPEVIQEMLDTGGENFLKGLDNLIRDVEKGVVSMTDTSAFQVGENIATTKGAVIYRNRMMELIQYAPTTGNVHKEPLLIIPPWINKYYILDLTSQNSMIKWLIDQGHTVFCISWVNPDESFRDIEFKDYMHDGVLTALKIINDICHTKQANVIGYCIGGTLLAMTLAWLKGKKRSNPVHSATFLTTLLDFEQAGDLKVFIDRDQVESLNTALLDQGVMDGKAMSLTFSMLRASDLIWSFIINNYLLGRDPVPFDLLYWNSDSTNLPAKMHCDYLSSFYLDNKLAKGEYVLDSIKLDLKAIDTSAYFLSTREDHIAPWQATQTGAELYGGDHTFILAGSGHVAGVINPPAKDKYGYEENGKHYAGSWWIHWQKWIENQNNSEPVLARNHLGNYNFKEIEQAPGTYVLKKL
tara:strand:- start:1544 stop:3349 length:1806 start_codon:yes stop_codon:yes gene_type:complete